MAEYSTSEVFGLQFGFEDEAGKSVSVTYSGVGEDLSVTTMKGVSDALIANKEAFVKSPATLVSVKYIDTITKEYDMEDWPK